MIKHEIIDLPNKVRLVLAEDKSKNQTYAELIVNFGGAVEKYKRNKECKKITPGLAHLMEHYLVENSIYGSMFNYFKEKFVTFNATTNFNKTRFYIDTVFDFDMRLEELIKLVNTPVFADLSLEKTKKPIIEEIKRNNDRLYNKFSKKINDCTYVRMKCRETTGSSKDVNSITVKELQEVHDLFYQVENQTIFIAGNFDTKKIAKLVEKIYGEIEREHIDYKILDKPEIAKVKKRKGHVIDPNVDEFINITFKIDLSKLTPKEKVKSTFYLSHFLNYNFNDSSSAYQTLSQNKDTIYSITTSTSYFLKDICLLDVGMYGTNLKKFKSIVFDVIKKKYADKEMFELWKKETLIKMIIRQNRVYSSGQAFLENVLTFGYNDIDKISDIEEFSLKDYKEFLNKLDFSNYTIVRQTKK